MRACRGASEAYGSGDAPDVDDLAAVELEAAVVAVGRADDEHVGTRQHLVKRDEARILDVGIRAKNLRALEGRELAHLVAERGACVVGVALERHAEDPDGPTR